VDLRIGVVDELDGRAWLGGGPCTADPRGPVYAAAPVPPHEEGGPRDGKGGTMRSRGMRRLRQAAGYLKYRFASQALILMYHRVAELPNDPYLLAVSPKHFAQQMEVIRRYGVPMRLGRLVDALQEGKIPKRAIVLTFDDGYADNLYNAKPLLERYDIPATVFVTTGHVGQLREFWWDEVDRLLLQPGTLPPLLELSLNGRRWRWELGNTATYTTADYEWHRDWQIEQQDDPTSRQRVFRSLYQRLHTLTAEDRQQLLGELRTWAGAEPIGRPTHRTLSPDEVVHLAEGGLVEIGAHSVTHPMLAALGVVAQQEEIRCSRAHLEEMLNHPVTSFAYPHGSYTPETLAVVRQAGFSSACSSDTALVRRRTNGFRLPRICVRDWDGETFARWLKGMVRRLSIWEP
jgi:peptidoglycan/xylan/chitin deacetylase (PgdA/CDA1 family)